MENLDETTPKETTDVEKPPNLDETTPKETTDVEKPPSLDEGTPEGPIDGEKPPNLDEGTPEGPIDGEKPPNLDEGTPEETIDGEKPPNLDEGTPEEIIDGEKAPDPDEETTEVEKPVNLDDVEPKEIIDVERRPKERKLFLREESEIITQHLDTYLGRAKQLLHEMRCLEKEAEATQKQNKDYQSCKAKCSQDPPEMLLTLNERNCRDLAKVQAQKEKLIPQYAKKEEEVRNSLKDTEDEAEKVEKELEELEPCREQKVQAEQRVKELERELRVTRIRCAEETHNIRTTFRKDKANCEQEIQQRMQALTWGAEEVALQALIQHVQEVKTENRHIRLELVNLLQNCQMLRETRRCLQDQQEQLLREIQCAQGSAARGLRRRRDNLQCSLTPSQLSVTRRK